MATTMIELTVAAPDRELAITYRGRTFDLVAFALEDFGIWDATAHEQGADGPALPAVEWGSADLSYEPWTCLSLLVSAIIRRVDMEEGGDGR